jgi:hypothetical protein
MTDLDLSKGIDLSALTAKPAQPPGTVRCEVEGGCNFLVQGTVAHASKDDCLATALPYVAMYMECEEAAIQIVEQYKRLEAHATRLSQANANLYEANKNLLADVDKYAADLRRLRKDNPEEQKSALLEAAGNLVSAVKPAADPVAQAAKDSAAKLLRPAINPTDPKNPFTMVEDK